MKRTFTALSAGLLLLGGCASSVADGPEPPAGAPSESPTIEPEKPTVEPSEAPTEEEPVEEEPDPETIKESPRGNIIKEVGEPAQLVIGEDDVTFELEITEIEFDFDCGSSADKPSNGTFVAFHIEAETTEHWPEDDHIQVTMHDFRAWDADGTRINDITKSAYSCDVANYLPPEPFRPSDKVRGTLVFDLPETAWVAYEPWGDGGWEWLVERS